VGLPSGGLKFLDPAIAVVDREAAFVLGEGGRLEADRLVEMVELKVADRDQDGQAAGARLRPPRAIELAMESR
jgi:hypothetical protein